MLVHQALIARLNDPEPLSELPLEETRLRSSMADLVMFFSTVVDHPENYGLKSTQDNKRILRAAKPVKGPAQPRSGRNRRKARQEARTRTHKARRRENRETAAQFNEARAKVEAEQLEAQEAFKAAVEEQKERFQRLVSADSLTAEQVQDLLELVEGPDLATVAREMRAENDPQARIDAAFKATGLREEADG